MRQFAVSLLNIFYNQCYLFSSCYHIFFLTGLQDFFCHCEERSDEQSHWIFEIFFLKLNWK